MCENNVELPQISESVLELQTLAAAECTCECCAPPVCQLSSYNGETIAC